MRPLRNEAEIGYNRPQMAKEKYLVDTEKVLAVLINPKTRELIEVRRDRTSSVRLANPGEEEPFSGSAYWDAHEEFEFDGDDYIRSHSPNAGVERGKGYGVVLYSGLCLRAFSDTNAMGIASTDGTGRHSSRSSYATVFWERAVENGLAEEGYAEGTEHRTYEDEGDSYSG